MTDRALLILGCGGHGRVVADAARERGYDRIAFLDDRGSGGTGAPVLGSMALVEQLAGEWPEAIVAVGNNEVRDRLFHRLRELGFSVPSLVHPSAIVSRQAEIAEGCFVGAGAIVNVGASIGAAAIVNTGARIDHDCTIGGACHVAPGATLSGTVTVGRRAWLGTGCSVRQNVTIGEGAVIGVGAAVVSDVPAGKTYVGVPARALDLKTPR